MDTGAAVEQEGIEKVEDNGSHKNKKLHCQLCFCLFSYNVDLKNNNKNYRNPF